MKRPTTVGVLAIQGAFAEHASVLGNVGMDVRFVREAAELVGLDGLVIPGGESTTLGLVGGRAGLLTGIRAAIEAGLPVFGTCAGLIMLARETTSGPQPLIGGMDIVVRRNAYGRQRASFEAYVEMSVLGASPFPGVFIRAPWIESVGSDVDMLAFYEGHGVAARSGQVLATAFHPELTRDSRVHEYFVDMVHEARVTRPNQGGGDVGAQQVGDHQTQEGRE